MQVGAWLNNSNDPIESNFKKNDQYWKGVAAAYNSSIPSNRTRQMKHIKDRFGKIKKKVGMFCGAWKEANSLYASGESDVDLMEKAQKLYEANNNEGPFMFMHCWNVLRNEPKWHAYLDRVNKSNKRKFEDEVGVAELRYTADNAEDIPRPIGAKAAKASRNGMGKGKAQASMLDIEDELCRFEDIVNGAKQGRGEMLQAQKHAHLAAKEHKEAVMLETFRDLMNKDTSGMPEDVRCEHVLALKSMREKLFGKTD